MTGRARNCGGHEAAASTSLGYADYLQLPGLLSLQQPVGAPPVPDELLFIKTYDSDHTKAWQTPHTSFVDPSAGEDAIPRASLDIRAAVSWD